MNEELKVIISAETNKLKTGVEKAKKSIKGFSDETKKKVKEATEEFQKYGDVATKALKVVGGAVLATGTALLALGASTKEYREAQAKLNTAFETAGMGADEASLAYNGLYRVLGDSDTAVEAAGHLAKVTKGEKNLTQWTKICTGVYATFGDSLPIEGLTEAANETAKTGQLTGVLADALNWAGISEDDFQASLNACNSEAEREALIRETLNGLYSDAAENYEKNNAAVIAQNEAQGKLNDAIARLGEAVAPINTMLTELAAEILAKLAPYVEDFAAKHLPSIKEALAGVAEKIGAVMNWIIEHWELVSTIAEVLLGIAVAIKVVTTALTVINAVMAASPTTWIILAVVAAIALLTAGIILCIKYWDEIKAAVASAVSAISEWVGNMVATVSAFFTTLWTNLTTTAKAIWTDVSTFFKGLWVSLVAIVVGIWTSVSTWFANLKDSMVEKVTEAWESVVEKFEAIKTSVIEKVQSMKTSVVNFFIDIKTQATEKIETLKTNLSNAWNSIKETASTLWTNIKNAVLTPIKSVKTLATSLFEVMKTSIETKFNNVWTTATTVWENIKSAITSPIESAKETIGNVIESIKGFLDFDWEFPKLKMPHFKVTGSANPFDWFSQGVPKLSVEWYAKGGVFDKTTMFAYGGNLGGLGEDGAEAVVPLEKNTEWLDKIAERLNGSHSNQPIILEVDGKVFAQTSIDSINQMTRQTGSLGLVIV